MSQPPSLRERHRSETRDTIRRTAIGLVLERGLADVTVEEIAEAVGIAPRTFFNHFRTKLHALVTSPAPPDASLLKALAAGDGPLVDDLCSLIVHHSRELQPERDLIRQAAELVRRYPELNPLMYDGFRQFEGVLAEAIDRRLARTDDIDASETADASEPTDAAGPAEAPPPSAAAMALAATTVALYRSASRGWLSAGCGVPLDGLVEEAFAALRLLGDRRSTVAPPARTTAPHRTA